MSVIIFDVDGVLADFDLAFTTLGHELFGTPITSAITQPQWDFRNLMSDQQQSAVWDKLRQTFFWWWASLKPLISSLTFSRINELNDSNYTVYFVTSRVHDITPVGRQTRIWLRDFGIKNPQVIVSAKKGEVARAINAQYALEDNWGNACAIHWMADGCKTFLIERRYNEEARKIIPPNIRRVKTVDEFIDRVEEDSR